MKSIEIIADYENENLNPIFLDKEALNHLKTISNDTGVTISSICADYFMKYHLLNNNDLSINQKSLDKMKKLISNCAYMGINNIVIPLVDDSSIKNFFEDNKLVDSFIEIMMSLLVLGTQEGSTIG